MFADFLKRLTQPEPDTLVETEARLALAALLVRLAGADNEYVQAEKDRIEAVLQSRYTLTPEGAQALRVEAEALEAEAPDTVRFTRAIKDAVTYDNRIGVIEALWEVALADGKRDDDEDALVRLAASLLGVSDVDNAKARQRVTPQS